MLSNGNSLGDTAKSFPSVAHFLGHHPLEPHSGQHLNVMAPFALCAIYYALAVCLAHCGRDSSEPLFGTSLPALRRPAGWGRGLSALLGTGWCRGEGQSPGPGETSRESGNSEIPWVSSHVGFKENVDAGLQSAEE